MGRNWFCYHPVNGHVQNDLNPDVDYHYTEREVKIMETIEECIVLFCFYSNDIVLVICLKLSISGHWKQNEESEFLGTFSL